MLSPTLHCIVLLIATFCVFCRYSIRSFDYFPAVIRDNDKHLERYEKALHKPIPSVDTNVFLPVAYWDNEGIFYQREELIPSYLIPSMKGYFKKSAAFQRYIAALILTTPVLLGLSFILWIVMDYATITNIYHLNSWALLPEAFNVCIKTDVAFYVNVWIIFGMLMGIMIILSFIIIVMKAIKYKKIDTWCC